MFANQLPIQNADVSRRAEFLYKAELTVLRCWTDRLFLVLLVLQWVIGIVVACWFSPRTWSGPASETHPHVWAAVFLGGALTLFPAYLVLARPGTALTRYVIAVAQMLWSALLIHLTGGRIETHFHIFGSLAFLTFYRDWRVLATATVVIIADHLVRGSYWPESVYGIATSGIVRSLEHGFWVIFEDAFLVISLRQSLKQSWAIAFNQALLEQRHTGEIDAKNLDLKQTNQLLEAANRCLQIQILERNEATDALKVSEDRYRRIVELSPFAILVVKNDRISFVNPPCVKLLNAESIDQVLDKSLMTFIHPDHHSLIAGRLCQADLVKSSAEAISAEAVLRCADGTAKDVEFCAFAFAENGETSFQVFLYDISERKRLETQHRQAQKMEVTGQLAGGIAHDFNNLLAVILGCCQFLETDESLNDDNRGLLEEIYKAANRAATLTRQLLAYSRQQVLQSTILDLNEVVTETGTMLERLIGEDIILTSKLSSRLWSVKVDEGQIQQVIMNLAVNARDAMPQGGKLTIETANIELTDADAHEFPDTKPGGYVLLSVRDTGCGMDEMTKSRIFEPFFTTKGVGKGTGLGLATVFGIVKQSGGHVSVSSKPGAGSTFQVYLPKVESKYIECTEGPQPAPARGTETVLVVEDEDGVRNLASRILRCQGYHVLEARNGSEGLRAVEEYQGVIELVVTDVVMPEMSGRQLHERLAAIQPQLPVLYMSGYTDDAIVRHGILESETNFIQKPFSFAGLANAVRKVLDEHLQNAGLLRV